MKLLTSVFYLRKVDRMSQRNSHRSMTNTDRLTAGSGLLQVRGTFVISLVLVLLIINGGAG